MMVDVFFPDFSQYLQGKTKYILENLTNASLGLYLCTLLRIYE
ncbi:MAG: hypothetical protein RLZZ382_185 [Bacteroidota bacterium]|jgi:hypothetical protein